MGVPGSLPMGVPGSLPCVSIARSIIQERKAAGMSQQELARLAGVRQETISRIDSGQHSPTFRTVEKIDRALRQATARGKRKSAKRRGV